MIHDECDSCDVQDDIDRLVTWSDNWKMSLNYSKCVVLHVTLKRKPINSIYHINSHRLESVNTHTDLGVALDSKMTFIAHVGGTVFSGRKLLGMI